MDPIADFITQLNNAGRAGKETVVLPYSKLKNSIALALEKEGYIKTQTKKGKKVGKSLEMTLVYEGNIPKIKGVERVSTPSKRIYYACNDLKPVKNNYGSLLLSTSKGILVDKEAKKLKTGGEALFKIW